MWPPRPSIEDSRQRRHHHISPVEVRRALIEVRQPQQHRRHQQRGRPSQPSLQQIQQPPSKEQLPWNRNQQKRKPERPRRMRRRPARMEVQKPQPHPQHDRNRRIQRLLPKSHAKIAQPQPRIGFVHEFRALAAAEVQTLLEENWTALASGSLAEAPAPDLVAAIIRVTSGNFRLITRLLTQMERMSKIDQLKHLSPAVAETAHENLVIGRVGTLRISCRGSNDPCSRQII
jgi:hypothetical protein